MVHGSGSVPSRVILSCVAVALFSASCHQPRRKASASGETAETAERSETATPAVTPAKTEEAIKPAARVEPAESEKTVAVELSDRDRYIVWYDFLLEAPMETRLRFGPTGAHGFVKGNHLVVRGYRPGSPAMGRLQRHDVIVGANGRAFPEGCAPRRELADAITWSETEKGGGKLALSVIREGKLREITIPVDMLGTYSPTWPENCSKSRKILDNACDYIVKWMAPNGQSDFFWNQYILIAHPDPKYRDSARRAAYFMVEDRVAYDSGDSRPYVRGLTAWRWGLKGSYLAEYYLETGDSAVLPELQRVINSICKGQMKSGGWGHRAPWGGYGGVNAAGVPCFTAMVLAREAGLDVDQKAMKKAEAFLERYVGAGGVPYGDHLPFGSRDNNGKSGAAAVAFDVMGRKDYSRLLGSMSCLSYETYEDAHTNSFWSWFWSPVAGAYSSKEEYRGLLDGVRWYYELARTDEGGFVSQPTPENLSGRTWAALAARGPRMTTGGMALFYARPYRRLRMLGKPKTVFSATSSTSVKELQSLYRNKKWGELDAKVASMAARHEDVAASFKKLRRDMEADVAATLKKASAELERGNILLAHEQVSALKRYIGSERPEFAAVLSRIPADRLAREREAADGYFPHHKMASWLQDSQIWDATSRAVATGDTYYGRRAREQMLRIYVPESKHKWKPVVGAPGIQEYRVHSWKDGPPPSGFAEPGFDEGAWRTVKGPVPGSKTRMVIRSRIDVDAVPEGLLGLKLTSPDDARVYLNGHAIAGIVRVSKKKNAKAVHIALHRKTNSLLRSGANVIAVHCRGGHAANVDVSLVYSDDAPAAPTVVDAGKVVAEGPKTVMFAPTTTGHGPANVFQARYKAMSLAQLRDRMANDVPTHRRFVAEAIAAKKSGAGRVVLAALSDSDWRVRSCAVEAVLVMLEPFKRAPRAEAEKARAALVAEMPRLIDRLGRIATDDDHYWARCGAARALCEFKEQARPAAKSVAQAAGDKNEWVREVTVGGIEGVTNDRKILLEAARNAIAVPNTSFATLWKSNSIFRKHGIDGPGVSDALITQIRTPGEGMWSNNVIAAMTLLTKHDPNHKDLVDTLAGVLNSSDFDAIGNARKTACKSLQTLGARARPALPALRQALAAEQRKDPNSFRQYKRDQALITSLKAAIQAIENAK